MSEMDSRGKWCEGFSMWLSSYLAVRQQMCDIELLNIQSLDRGIDEIVDNGSGGILDGVFSCLEFLVGFIHSVPSSIFGVLGGTLSRALGVIRGVGGLIFCIVKNTPSEDLVQVDRSVGSGQIQIFQQGRAGHGGIQSVELHALEGIRVCTSNQATNGNDERDR